MPPPYTALIPAPAPATAPATALVPVAAPGSLMRPPPPPVALMQPLPLLPAGWTEHMDRSSGRMFYHHSATGMTQWEKPVAAPYASASAGMGAGWSPAVTLAARASSLRRQASNSPRLQSPIPSSSSSASLSATPFAAGTAPPLSPVAAAAAATPNYGRGVGAEYPAYQPCPSQLQPRRYKPPPPSYSQVMGFR